MGMGPRIEPGRAIQKAQPVVLTMKAVGFEVSGNIQRVGFKSYTKFLADRLELRGYIINTHKGVLGHIEGPEQKVNFMKECLSATGSPRSQMLRVHFWPTIDIPEHTYADFRSGLHVSQYL